MSKRRKHITKVLYSGSEFSESNKTFWWVMFNPSMVNMTDDMWCAGVTHKLLYIAWSDKHNTCIDMHSQHLGAKLTNEHFFGDTWLFEAWGVKCNDVFIWSD